MRITAERLRELLHYEPDTGVFTWRVCRYRVQPGAVAGYPHVDGYVQIGVERRVYYAHKLAWLYMTGEWPQQIDHRNRIRNDNRWSNLRLATNSQNHANSATYRNNRCGLKGVSWNRKDKRWRATIAPNKRRIYLGSFRTKEAAHAAYAAAAQHYFGQFARAQ